MSRRKEVPSAHLFPVSVKCGLVENRIFSSTLIMILMIIVHKNTDVTFFLLINCIYLFHDKMTEKIGESHLHLHQHQVENPTSISRIVRSPHILLPEGMLGRGEGSRRSILHLLPSESVFPLRTDLKDYQKSRHFKRLLNTFTLLNQSWVAILRVMRRI